MYDVNLSMIPLRRAKTRKIFRRLIPISKRKRITATRNGHYVGIPDVSISDVCSRLPTAQPPTCKMRVQERAKRVAANEKNRGGFIPCGLEIMSTAPRGGRHFQLSV